MRLASNITSRRSVESMNREKRAFIKHDNVLVRVCKHQKDHQHTYDALALFDPSLSLRRITRIFSLKKDSDFSTRGSVMQSPCSVNNKQNPLASISRSTFLEPEKANKRPKSS